MDAQATDPSGLQQMNRSWGRARAGAVRSSGAEGAHKRCPEPGSVRRGLDPGHRLWVDRVRRQNEDVLLRCSRKASFPFVGNDPPPPPLPGRARTWPQATRRSASLGASGGPWEWRGEGAVSALQFAWEGNRDFPFALYAGNTVPALRGQGDAALWGKSGWQEVAGLLEEMLGCAAVAAEKGPEDATRSFPRAAREPRGEDGQGLSEGGTGEPGVSGLQGAEALKMANVPTLPSPLAAGSRTRSARGLPSALASRQFPFLPGGFCATSFIQNLDQQMNTQRGKACLEEWRGFQAGAHLRAP
uniref:Uncharacterized protein n=1 Tax=Nomascus leucogenys TaxID=61853 RepID=A0A2I3GWE5_NOMLE